MPGYLLYEGQCYRNNQCNKIGDNVGALAENICSDCPEGCAQCDYADSPECRVCEAGWFLASVIFNPSQPTYLDDDFGVLSEDGTVRTEYEEGISVCVKNPCSAGYYVGTYSSYSEYSCDMDCDSGCEFCFSSGLSYSSCPLCQFRNYGRVSSGDCPTVENISCSQGKYPVKVSSTELGCSDCDSSCLTCSTSPTSCDSCSSNKFLKDSSCVEDCGKSYFANDSTQECEECSTNCKECSSVSVCTQCFSDYYEYDASSSVSCVSSCPSSFVLNSDETQCVSSCTSIDHCKTCDNSSCSYCYDNYHRVDGTCYSVCPLYSETEEESQKCSCPANCAGECDSSFSDGFMFVCSSCESGYSLFNGAWCWPDSTKNVWLEITPSISSMGFVQRTDSLAVNVNFYDGVTLISDPDANAASLSFEVIHIDTSGSGDASTQTLGSSWVSSGDNGTYVTIWGNDTYFIGSGQAYIVAVSGTYDGTAVSASYAFREAQLNEYILSVSTDSGSSLITVTFSLDADVMEDWTMKVYGEDDSGNGANLDIINLGTIEVGEEQSIDVAVSSSIELTEIIRSLKITLYNDYLVLEEEFEINMNLELAGDGYLSVIGNFIEQEDLSVSEIEELSSAINSILGYDEETIDDTLNYIRVDYEHDLKAVYSGVEISCSQSCSNGGTCEYYNSFQTCYCTTGNNGRRCDYSDQTEEIILDGISTLIDNIDSNEDLTNAEMISYLQIAMFASYEFSHYDHLKTASQIIDSVVEDSLSSSVSRKELLTTAQIYEFLVSETDDFEDNGVLEDALLYALRSLLSTSSTCPLTNVLSEEIGLTTLYLESAGKTTGEFEFTVNSQDFVVTLKSETITRIVGNQSFSDSVEQYETNVVIGAAVSSYNFISGRNDLEKYTYSIKMDLLSCENNTRVTDDIELWFSDESSILSVCMPRYSFIPIEERLLWSSHYRFLDSSELCNYLGSNAIYETDGLSQKSQSLELLCCDTTHLTFFAGGVAEEYTMIYSDSGEEEEEFAMMPVNLAFGLLLVYSCLLGI